MVKKIKLLALDIDGVLTDGRTVLGARHPERKRLAFQDLDAINAARRAGLLIALVTGESDGSVDLVAARTGVELVRRGAKDKLAALQSLARELKISLAEICYVGDGDRDAPALAEVVLAFAPLNATFAARCAAHQVLQKPGGQGAVNEAVRLLLKLRAWAETEKNLRSELRRKLTAKKIPLRHLPEEVKLALELNLAIQSGRKILLAGEDAEGALRSMFWGKFDWPAVVLSPLRTLQKRQTRALARPGDLVIFFSESGRIKANVPGITVLKLSGKNSAALWSVVVQTVEKLVSRRTN